ncbi:MAG: DNA topoisomerase IV subunit A [Treponema sp.]|nr:DNA topoisomerase IV subunit A [Treponema sp.]
MAFVKDIFEKNFIDYASYVIRDRAIPELEDGLKPVQRRILHTLFTTDDGKFNKVANVVGECMKYHPHGDASIYGALVVLANKELFIDKQGNFGNMYTGDSASAPRYIECRIKPLARDILYSPTVTNYVPSYDGRNKEPVTFPAKLPLVLIMGAEGIAVGMSTKILSHNVKEVIEAEKKCLRGQKFTLYPDFPTGGLCDVSDYQDGLGKIVTRAKLDLTDEKKIVITELPFGSTTETLMNSIEAASKLGRVKISSINDYTSNSANIEIKLPRGVYAKDVVPALYAYTECEQSISCNLLVIKYNMPVRMTVSDVIKYHAENLKKILKKELEAERAEQIEKLHLRTLERIFIEERIYKAIENQKTAEDVDKAVRSGFVKFQKELVHDIKDDDVEHLLKIPIRRISLFDINKNRDEVTAINARIAEIDKLLADLTSYAIATLSALDAKIDKSLKIRHTEIAKFEVFNKKDVIRRDIALRYDDKGNLGTKVSGGSVIMQVSPYDRIFFIRKNGMYSITSETPSKLFVGPDMWACCLGDKESLNKVLFTIIYKDPSNKCAYIKRCRIGGYIMNRDYMIVPEEMEILHIDTRDTFGFTLTYKKGRLKNAPTESFNAAEYAEKGLKAQGVRLNPKEVISIDVSDEALEKAMEKPKDIDSLGQKQLF